MTVSTHLFYKKVVSSTPGSNSYIDLPITSSNFSLISKASIDGIFMNFTFLIFILNSHGVVTVEIPRIKTYLPCLLLPTGRFASIVPILHVRLILKL